MYHFENYIQIQNDELTLGPEKFRNSVQSKQNGALQFTVMPGYSQNSHTEKVNELMFKKYFKILLLSKS